MDTYPGGKSEIRIEHYEPGAAGPHPALLMLHGSGGAVSYWLQRFAPALTPYGVGLHVPHYFDKTGTIRATAETTLDGQHFPAWLQVIQDGAADLRARPSVNPRRIGVLGISVGGYLAVAMGLSDPTLRPVIELSGGIPPGWQERVSPPSPPILVVHGAEDTIVSLSEARKLEGLLGERNAHYRIEIFSGENHWFSAQTTPRLLMTCSAFLAQHL